MSDRESVLRAALERKLRDWEFLARYDEDIPGEARISAASAFRECVEDVRAVLAGVTPSPQEAVLCKHGVTFATCGDTGCALHGEYEAQWNGRGASPEREEAFRRLVLSRMMVPSPQPSEAAIAAADAAYDKVVGAWLDGTDDRDHPAAMRDALVAAYAVDFGGSSPSGERPQ